MCQFSDDQTKGTITLQANSIFSVRNISYFLEILPKLYEISYFLLRLFLVEPKKSGPNFNHSTKITIENIGFENFGRQKDTL